jgi:cytosine/adenosine deaminase-related metal-dependent hydrolase
MDARTVLYMATMGGAKVMGKEKEIGSLEEGKKADIILLDMNKAHSSPSFKDNIESAIVFSGKTDNVETTIVDGKILMENKVLLSMSEKEIVERANSCIKEVWERAFK